MWKIDVDGEEERKGDSLHWLTIPMVTGIVWVLFQKNFFLLVLLIGIIKSYLQM